MGVEAMAFETITNKYETCGICNEPVRVDAASPSDIDLFMLHDKLGPIHWACGTEEILRQNVSTRTVGGTAQLKFELISSGGSCEDLGEG